MSQARAEERKTETIPEWKREEVADLVETLEGFDSIGVVAIGGIPSRQLQDMRRGLHGTAELRVSRNTLLRRALDEVGLSELKEHIAGQVGLVGTNDNPFALYRELEASKTPAPISAGEVAPNDIVIPEGDTGVADGQFIGDLKQVGVDSRFQDGAVAVTEESVALEAGGEVSTQLENVLSTLGIEPKEVGLDLRAVVSDGVLFDPADLDIDYDAYRQDVQTAGSRARNLAVNAAVPEPGVLPSLLSKAAGEARSLGLAAGLTEPGLMEDLLRNADADVRALAAHLDDDALPEELKGAEPAPAEEAVEETPDDDADEPAEQEETADEDDSEDGDDDDDVDAGMGDLFG
jgi:large subunit ribosomal protein L10